MLSTQGRVFVTPAELVMKAHLVGPVLLSALIIFTTSCGAISGVKQCRFEQRGVSASGEFVLPDATTLTAHVDLAEQRESSSQPDMARLLIGSQSYSLYGHMTGAELRDNQTPSALLGSFLPGVGQETWAPNLIGTFKSYDWPLTIEQARALIESGELVMEIRTDLPEQSLLRIPLTTTTHSDGTWFRERGDACG
jgi:hypothetical protein